MSDLKFAFRQLLKSPGSTTIMLATLALVIGALSLALGIVEQQRLTFMPFPDANQLVMLWRFAKASPQPDFPAGVYAAAAGKLKGVSAMAALGDQAPQVLTGAGEPKSLSVQYVTASAFQVAGIQPRLGRAFTKEEQEAGREDLLVISYHAWRSFFGGDRSVIGRGVHLNGKACTIVGVMPRGFARNALFYGVDAWLPRDFDSPSRYGSWVRLVARRADGFSAAELNSEVEAALPRLLKAFAEDRKWQLDAGSVRARPLDKRPPGDVDSAAAISAASIAIFAVAIAVFNLANILLGRMLQRRHEIAVRFSLGASRARIARQLLVESVLLSIAGGIAGSLVAFWVAGIGVSRGITARFNLPVVALTALVALAIGLAVGWLPAWRATRGDLAGDLKEAAGASRAGGRQHHRWRGFLVIGQVAMASSLCIAAGLLARSYLNKQRFEPGFDTTHLLSLNVLLGSKTYDSPERRLSYIQEPLEQIRAIPGVEAASVASDKAVDRLPFPIGFRLEGQEAWPRRQDVGLTLVSPNYLPMVHLPVLRGRGLNDGDGPGAPGVAVVNQSFVRRYLAGKNPLGKRFSVPLGRGPHWITIVGVVPDQPNVGYERNLGPEAYLCFDQFAPDWASPVFLVRCRPSPLLLRDALRRAVHSVDQNVPVSSPVTVGSQVERAVQRNVGVVWAVSAIGLFGLIMAALGVYAVVAYSVTERTHELGVRLALGATPG